MLTGRRPRWVQGWPFVCGALFAAFSAHRLADADLFWHLALGRAVLESKARVVAEPIALPGFGARCIVHEWLWDALTYAVQQSYGWVGLSLLVMAVAAAAGIAFGLLVTRWRHDPPTFAATLALTLLAAPIILTRINERPETAAMVFWPLGLLLARSLARASSLGTAAPRAVALVALAAIWSQVHLSLLAFVPAAAVLLVPSAVGRMPVERLRAVVLLLVSGAVLASAPGLLVFTVPARVSPYIAEHVAEWMPLRWTMLDPTTPDNVQGPAFAVLAIVALVLGWKQRRALTTEYLLALVGLALATQGRRGVTPAALLTLPLASCALDFAATGASVRARAWRWATVAMGLLTTWRMAQWTERHVGQLGRLGLDEGAFPLAAARLLDRVPGDHRALTTYRSGPPLAFQTRSRVRTFVDSRTPIFYFDDGDLAAARTAWGEPKALPIVAARYGFDVAVVDRDMPVCYALGASPEWALAVVEPQFATFVRVGAAGAAGAPAALPALQRVRPCGERYLDDKSCAPPLAELDAEVERVAAFSSPAFGGYLRADKMLRCASGRFDGDAIAALLPSANDASGFRAARDDVYAWLLALAGRKGEALDLLAPHVADGKDWVLEDSLPSLAKGGADDLLRETLGPLVRSSGDAANEAWVVTLANACARTGDVDCARVQGTRAAALGRFDVGPALCFLRSAGGTAGARADADRWLDTLRRGAPAAAQPFLACPPR